MSQTPDEKQYRRYTTINTKYASTPQGNISIKRCSISLSRIDTGSSSNRDGISWKQSQISEKRKRSKKNKKPAKKRKQVFQLQDTDSEWETESEKLINESLNSQEYKADNASMRINLFESPRTPEKIRDALRFEENLLHESPIIQSSRRLRPISKDIDIIRNQLLPVHLPSMELRNRIVDADEDELIFNYETNVKTYSSARKPENHESRKSPEEKLGNFMFPTRMPTLVSDRLWNQFIEKHYGKTSHYMVSLSPRESNNNKLTSSESESEFSNVFDKLETDPIPPGMKCIRGYWDKDSRKWKVSYNFKHESQLGEGERRIRKRNGKGIGKKNSKKKRKEETLVLPLAGRQRTTVYDEYNETDIEFETGGKDNKRMSLTEFRQKQNMNKVSKISLISSESSSE